MNTPCEDKPPNDPYVWELIELDLHRIDKSWWTILSSIAISLPLFGMQGEPGPHPPKQPIQLRMYLHDYASELFKEEIKHYPNDLDCSAHWAQRLADRVVERIMQRIGEMEAPRISSFGRVSLTYHGIPHLEMHDIIRECLEGLMEEWLPSEPQEQEADSAKIRETADSKESAIAPAPSEVERRKTLLAEYKAATGVPSDYQIFNADNSGLYKPEFYKWLKGTLSAHSKTSRNFERFLRDKKLPIPRK